MKRLVACQSQLFGQSYWYIASGKSEKHFLDEKSAKQYAAKLDLADLWRRFRNLEVFEGKPKPNKNDDSPAWDERWERFREAEMAAGRA